MFNSGLGMTSLFWGEIPNTCLVKKTEMPRAVANCLPALVTQWSGHVQAAPGTALLALIFDTSKTEPTAPGGWRHPLLMLASPDLSFLNLIQFGKLITLTKQSWNLVSPQLAYTHSFSKCGTRKKKRLIEK